MTESYDFRTQMITNYDVECYQAAMEMFDQLPLAACVNGDYLAVHGGISDRFQSFDQLNTITRACEPDDECLMNDLLWADPIHGEAALDTRQIFNQSRATSVKFGWTILQEILQKEKLKALVRAHEEEGDGFKFHMWDK